MKLVSIEVEKDSGGGGRGGGSGSGEEGGEPRVGAYKCLVYDNYSPTGSSAEAGKGRDLCGWASG